jgi:hypothetical protein
LFVGEALVGNEAVDQLTKLMMTHDKLTTQKSES